MKRILSFLLCLTLLVFLALLLPGLGSKRSAGMPSQALPGPTPGFTLLEPLDGFEIERILLQPGDRQWLVQCAYDDAGRFFELRQRVAGPGETFPPGQKLDLSGGRWGVIERGLAGHVVLSDGSQIPFEEAIRLTWVERGMRLELLSNLPEDEMMLTFLP